MFMTRMPNIEYLDIPPIPESLYNDIIESIKGESYIKTDVETYRICEAKQSIYDFVLPLFNKTVDTVNIQQFTSNIPPHIDGGSADKINFIICQGNENITTHFHGKDYKESFIIEPFCWHRLNVSERHSVTGFRPGDKRISVSVFKSLRWNKLPIPQ